MKVVTILKQEGPNYQKKKKNLTLPRFYELWNSG